MFKWVPCRGPSAEAVERMRAHFPKPSEPMGEAWFLSEERYFHTWLAETPVAEADAGKLIHCLFEIASGTGSFGRMEDWEAWFRYMLPDLILRGHEHHAFETLLEPTVTAFMVLFPGPPDGEYAGFREDALAALGACLMGPEMWENCDAAASEAGAQPLGRFLKWEDEEGSVGLSGWDAGLACQPMSASLFFCLKYLNEEEVEAWAESVFAIEDPYFRASLAVWLVGALDLLESGEARPRAITKSSPRVEWHDSFLLESAYEGRDVNGAHYSVNDVRDFLPRANRAAFVRAVRRLLTTETLLAWADAFSEDAPLYENFYHVPDLLFDRLAKA
ncbi:MAG TPA: hypothetical protein VM936_21515 [Pyrinomonadaceae bacterium]|jgi:hypothetical protein|nr:hypothetical protein [Pyrinomonadaceae bacterium]